MKYFLVFALLLAVPAHLLAQDHSVTPIDGPVVKLDSLKNRPDFTPQLYNPYASTLMPLFEPLAIPRFESKEQKARRINDKIRSQVTQNIFRFALPQIRNQVYAPFLSGTPAGFVRLSGSNPSILGREPGKYPYDNPYSPENFPQTIRLEYDMATGTYKAVPVKWDDYTKAYNYRFNPGNVSNAPIPQVNLTPGDQIIRR